MINPWILAGVAYWLACSYFSSYLLIGLSIVK